MYVNVGVSKRKGWEPARIMIREVRIESVVVRVDPSKVVLLDHPQFDFCGFSLSRELSGAALPVLLF